MVLILSVFGSAIVVVLFYKNKLQQPLKLLNLSSKKIQENTLDFSIVYEKKDEMGQVCQSFESMRKQLEENYKRMWKLVENEKNLRAAMTHDIRAPLAVMHGYQEMLLEFVPQDKIEKERLIEMLEAGMKQMERLSDFIDTTCKLSSLEDREIVYKKVPYDTFKQQLLMTAETLCKIREVKWKLEEHNIPNELWIDAAVVYEVFENLLSNGIQFAEEQIEVDIMVEDGYLCIELFDDGTGFHKDFDTLTKAYYHDSQGDDLCHFGLGLYICRLLCEKHKGFLILRNQKTGGAYAKAAFGFYHEGLML